jgi:4-hydroxy-3-polyprenylbenzoate decarboxylase
MSRPLVLGVTGASGAPYAVRLIKAIVELQVPTYLIVSNHGWRLLRHEVGIDNEEQLRAHVKGDWGRVELFDNSDRGALPASGSVITRGMAVCPCSMGTLAAISHGNSRSLIERAADVTLKERRQLVLVPRETPLSEVHLRNMLGVTRAGAVVMPAAPGYYSRPQKVEELVDFIVARVLDHLDVPHEVGKRWSGE